MKKYVIAFLLIIGFLCFFLLMSHIHIHTWEDASCFNPRTCSDCGQTEGNPREHIWIEATCEEPKYCIACGFQDGSVLDHCWIEATCEMPQYCSNCKATEGTELGHNWTQATSNTPSECLNCGEMKPLELPKNGQVFIGANLYRGSELSIKSSTKTSCYIKLKSTAKKDVFSFFVRAGESVTVNVPEDNFYVYFSYGDDWYGTEHLFGPTTTFSKDDEILNFKEYTWEYTLYPVYNGNFSETPIDAEEFK